MKKNRTIADQKEEILQIIRSSAIALTEVYDEEGCFCDISKMNHQGVFADSVGLATCLLILVAFREEKAVFEGNDLNKRIQVIFDQTIDSIYKEWQEGLIGIEPNLKNAYFKKIDGYKPGMHYTDTLTWILSSCILARYASRRGLLAVNESQKNQMFELIAETFDILLCSQENGRWGFLSSNDPQHDIFEMSERSLFFTYGTNAAINDFADYVLGKIGDVEKTNDSADSFKYRDSELIEMINDRLKYPEGVAIRVDNVREKLSDWLLRECLPRLHKLSKCQRMSEDDLHALCIWDAYDETDSNLLYLNLYYTYYLIDLLISSGVDKRIANDPENCYHILNSNPSFLDEDRDLLEDMSTFFPEYMKRILWESDKSYSAAKETGNQFWDSPSSELRPQFRDQFGKTYPPMAGANVVDPALISMAMRAKIIFNYYCTSERRTEIEQRFFDDVATSRYVPGDERNKDCREYLWDDINFDLMVTERSIESTIDFYDYLNLIEEKEREAKQKDTPESEPAPQKEAEIIVEKKSALDLAMEDKIGEYLRSETGRQVLSEYLKSEEGQAILRENGGKGSKTEGNTEEDAFRQAEDVTRTVAEELSAHEKSLPTGYKVTAELNQNLYSIFSDFLRYKFFEIAKKTTGCEDEETLENMYLNFQSGMDTFLSAFFNSMKESNKSYNESLLCDYWNKLRFM